MEFLLNFLLNYITLSVAGIAFVLILAVLIRKRKTLIKKKPMRTKILISQKRLRRIRARRQ